MGMFDSPSFTSLAGQFLISESDLMDPNFYCTVVLMISHDPSGAFGLVINRPSTAAIEDIFPQFENHPAGHIPVFIGGPVEQEYLFLVQHGLELLPEGSILITDDIYFVPNVRPVLDYIHESWASLPHDRRPPPAVFCRLLRLGSRPGGNGAFPGILGHSSCELRHHFQSKT